jgi:hypothetical protein
MQGYLKPRSELLTQFPQLEKVAHLGYATAVGARCTECRLHDAEAALREVPQDLPSDVIERCVYQYRNWGFFEPLPRDGWGPSWAAAASKRGVSKGSYNMSEHAWDHRQASKFDDVPVWQFVFNEAGQSSGRSYYAGGISTVFSLDEAGRSPVLITFEERGLLRRKLQTRVEWPRGPVGTSGREVRDEWHAAVLRALIPDGIPTMWPRDETYIGIGPEAVFDWLMHRG